MQNFCEVHEVRPADCKGLESGVVAHLKKQMGSNLVLSPDYYESLMAVLDTRPADIALWNLVADNELQAQNFHNAARSYRIAAKLTPGDQSSSSVGDTAAL